MACLACCHVPSRRNRSSSRGTGAPRLGTLLLTQLWVRSILQHGQDSVRRLNGVPSAYRRCYCEQDFTDCRLVQHDNRKSGSFRYFQILGHGSVLRNKVKSFIFILLQRSDLYDSFKHTAEKRIH